MILKFQFLRDSYQQLSYPFLTLLLAAVSLPLSATQVYFVSLDGDDAWSGEFAEPLSEGSDGPVATLKAAQILARERNADASKPREEIIITVRGGDYPIDSTLSLTAEDSGIGPAPVTWQAWPGEEVILNGGTRVSGFKLLAKTDKGSRIPKKARKHVYVTNLKKQKIEYDASIERRRSYSLDNPAPFQLYYGDEIMTLARYPSDGFVTVADVPQDEGEPINEGHHADKRDGKVFTGRHYGAINYGDKRPQSWASYDDVWMHGYWTWDWAQSTQRIESIDTESKRITIGEPHHRYGYTTGQRYYYFNVPEELDSPGEWYLNQKSGDLYFWPPEENFSGELVISRFTEPTLKIQDAQHLTIKGFTIAYSRGPGIRISNSESITVDGCSFYSMGGRPVTIEGGHNCGVKNGYFTQISGGAIHMNGGDRTTLEAGNHYAVNNHIHDFSIVYRANHPAIVMLGVGNRIAHNYVHDAPHMAMRFTGNDHVLEYNEIHDIALETGDVGAIYIGRDYTSRGSIVRYNYLHHLHGPGLHGVRAVYLDDFSSGIVVFGNVFYQAGRAAFIGGGRNNRIQNNLFIECEPSVQIDGRGLSWANHHFDMDHSHYASTLRDFMAAANVSEPPYSTRYPELQYLYQDEPKVPKYNVVENNLSFGGIFLDLYDGVDLELATVRNNLINDPVTLRMTSSSDQDPDFAIYKFGQKKTKAMFKDNVLWKFDKPPYRIVDGHVQLDLDALPIGTGFLPIPIKKIGLKN